MQQHGCSCSEQSCQSHSQRSARRGTHHSASHWRSVKMSVAFPTSSADRCGLCFSTHSWFSTAPPDPRAPPCDDAAAGALFGPAWWRLGRLPGLGRLSGLHHPGASNTHRGFLCAAVSACAARCLAVAAGFWPVLILAAR